MKLNPTHMRYLTTEDFCVLSAIEKATRTQEIVSVKYVSTLSKLRPGQTNKILMGLANYNLVTRIHGKEVEGYSFGYGGADYLALKEFLKRKTAVGVGNRIGVGKESDIHLVQTEQGTACVLKVYRLGRTSFRTVRNNRNYLNKNQKQSWIHLSKTVAYQEFEFMKLLYQNGFPVPEPVDQNRHCILMEHIEGTLLNNISSIDNPQKLYETLIGILLKLACNGLIHGDFNEFNIILKEDGNVVLIDFPQVVSILHPNSQELFERDLECILLFFKKRFSYEPESIPSFQQDVERCDWLDSKIKEIQKNNPF